MATAINEVVKIGEFVFRRNLFHDLTRFFSSKKEFDNLFDPVGNRSGVYYFFNRSGEVSYIGCTENRAIRKRIYQYRSQSKTKEISGNDFWKNFHEQNPGLLFHDFEQHVQDLVLGTLSTGTKLNSQQQAKLTAVNKSIEGVLISEFEPLYNKGCYHRVTDNEYCRLIGFVSSPENSSE